MSAHLATRAVIDDADVLNGRHRGTRRGWLVPLLQNPNGRFAFLHRDARSARENVHGKYLVLLRDDRDAQSAAIERENGLSGIG